MRERFHLQQVLPPPATRRRRAASNLHPDEPPASSTPSSLPPMRRTRPDLRRTAVHNRPSFHSTLRVRPYSFRLPRSPLHRSPRPSRRPIHPTNAFRSSPFRTYPLRVQPQPDGQQRVRPSFCRFPFRSLRFRLRDRPHQSRCPRSPRPGKSHFPPRRSAPPYDGTAASPAATPPTESAGHTAPRPTPPSDRPADSIQPTSSAMRPPKQSHRYPSAAAATPQYHSAHQQALPAVPT